MRIGILNCDFDEDPSTNGGQLISSHLASTDDELVMFDAHTGILPSSEAIRTFDAVIITGSRASVYEDKEWITRLLKLICDIDKLNIPTLGICFGHQAIARALGGSVVKSGRFEEGFIDVTCTTDSPLFEGIQDTFPVYQSHGDIVSELPQGASILCENSFSLQAYNLRNFHCVQFHPEVLPVIATIMAKRDNSDVAVILNGIAPTYNLPLKVIFNFLEIARRNA